MASLVWSKVENGKGSADSVIMKRIKVIQIGIGHDHAIDVLDSVVHMTDVFEVAALAVPKCEMAVFADKMELCTQKMRVNVISVEEALQLQGIDAAIIETEEVNLCKYASLAAQNGLHVHMDKPGSAVYDEFEKLVELLKGKNLVFSVGYMYRFNPEIKSAIQAVERGELGKIYSVEAQMNCEHSLQKKQWLSRFPGGMMFFLGCHLIDLVYRLQGEPMEVLPLNTCTDKNTIHADDLGMAVFRYGEGVSFVKVCDSEPGGFARRQIVICGTKGTIEIRPIERWMSENIFSYSGCKDRKNMCSAVRKITTTGNWSSDAEFVQSAGFNRYDAMMENFAERIKGKKEQVYTCDYELNLYRLLQKACGRK